MNKSIHSQAFHRVFHVPLEGFASELTGFLGRFDFDIVRFDDWCKRTYGYTEAAHGSLKSFLRSKFGLEAARLVEKIIHEVPKKEEAVQ